MSRSRFPIGREQHLEQKQTYRPLNDAIQLLVDRPKVRDGRLVMESFQENDEGQYQPCSN